MGAGPATFSWATCFWPPQVPTSLLIGGPCVCFRRLSLCLDSLLSQNPTSCFPRTLQLHSQWALPLHTAPSMPLTCLALGIMSVPAWIWAPIAPGLSVQKPDAHRTASQAPTSCLACPLPSHPPGSSCSLPVVLLAEGLLGLGELFPPWPLLSVLHQLPSKYPWGLVREGFLFTFFPGEIIPPLVTWISAFSILGS